MPSRRVSPPTQTARAAAAVARDASRLEPRYFISYFLYFTKCLFNGRLRERMGMTSQTTVYRRVALDVSFFVLFSYYTDHFIL